MANGVIGQDFSVVSLRINGSQLLVAESYEIHLSVMTQPAAFAMRLGKGSDVASLAKLCPPNSLFELYVDDRLQFKGRTDGYTSADNSGAHELTVRGRDLLAPLHDNCPRAEHSFTSTTYLDLLLFAIKDAMPDQHGHVLSDDTANRQLICGSKLIKAAPPSTTQGDEPSGGQRTVQIKLGERWYDGVLKKQFDRVGLFLWCGADGNFILAEPNTSQKPITSILNKPQGDNPIVTGMRFTLKNETGKRPSSCEVHFRSGGGAETRTRAYGLANDDEIAALGIFRPLIHKDNECQSLAQADFLARKKVCDAGREGWSYVVEWPGHTFIDNAGTRCIWSPNIIVTVDDDENDVHEPLYLESVRMTRGPETKTELTFYRIKDLLFGEPADKVAA